MDLCGLQEWMSTILCGLHLWIAQVFRGPSSQSTAELNVDPELGIILSKFSVLQRRIQDSVGSSSRSTLEKASLPTIEKLNDYVHEVSISSGTPSVEIVFFHGLHLDGYTDPHISTWLSKDKSKLWLVWLLEEIPGARILIVSYDACAKRTGDQGMMDMYCTRENLLHSVTGKRANIGQEGCPVVLVGHCLGGLVMKELCVQANSVLGLKQANEQDHRVENFLWNVKGLFFYASPHHGSRLADNNKGYPKGALFEDVNTLNNQTARRNEEFRKVREKYEWKTFGVGEGREITLGSYFRGLVVPEASARSDVDGFYTIADGDHFTVCQPQSKDSSSFHLLSDFVVDVLKQDQNRLSTKGSLSAEGVGLEAHVEKISKTLQSVQRLGVVGIGGIGKTTLTKVVFDSILGRFDYTCFLGEVKKSMGARGDSEYLQTLILSKLHHNGRRVNEGFSWNTLKGKKVLIVLDDAEMESQVMVMTESDGFSKDSRVIVTARDSRFLITQDFSILWVEQLNLDDSIKLFCLHAFKRPVAPKAYEEQVTRFAEKCGGLPLALKIAGNYLYNQSPQAWNGAFDKLGRAKPLNGSIEDGLWSILRVSYNDLADEEREMFLDVATCFHGEELKEVQKAWRVCSWGSHVTGWQNLVDRGMVREDDYKKIWMHEVLRDLGRSIACPHDQNVARHTRVFDVGLTKQLLNQGKTLVKVLRIISDDPYEGPELVTMGSLARLMELQIIWLDGYSLDWLESMGDVCLPQLMFLRMQCFPRDIVALQRLGGLGSCRSIYLDFFCGHPNHDGDDRSDHFLSSLGQLYQLEHLELWNCRWLTTLPPQFGELSQLQHLKLTGCENLSTLPTEFGKLSQLQHLELTGCVNLMTLPAEFGKLIQLQHLELVDCERLTALPAEFGKLSELQHLELMDCTSLTTLLAEFGKLSQLQHLKLTKCKNLSTLPAEFGKLSQLQHLELTGCRNLTTVPAEFGKLSQLQHLDLTGWMNLTTLLVDFGKLSQLQHLELHCGHSLMSLPAEFGNLSQLQHLELHCGHNLMSLPAEFGNLSQLQHLEIHCGHNLMSLPAEVGNLSQLQHLKLKDCTNLATLPAEFRKLSQLQRLELVDLENLKTLPAEFGKLERLRHLEMLRVGLQELPNSFVQLEALEVVEVHCSHLLIRLSCLSDLPHLKRLNVDYCEKIDGWDALQISWSTDCSIKPLDDLTTEEFRLIKTINCQEGGVMVFSSNDSRSRCPMSLSTLFESEWWGQIQALQSLTIMYSRLPPDWLWQCKNWKGWTSMAVTCRSSTVLSGSSGLSNI